MASPGGSTRLGSAKHGVGPWRWQRLTAVALVPLSLWFVAALIAHLGAGYGAAVAWLGSPAPAIAMILFITAGFLHLSLGVQVIIEDYVEHRGTKTASLVLVRLVCWVLATAGIFAVLRIALRATI